MLLTPLGRVVDGPTVRESSRVVVAQPLRRLLPPSPPPHPFFFRLSKPPSDYFVIFSKYPAAAVISVSVFFFRRPVGQKQVSQFKKKESKKQDKART